MMKVPFEGLMGSWKPASHHGDGNPMRGGWDGARISEEISEHLVIDLKRSRSITTSPNVGNVNSMGNLVTIVQKSKVREENPHRIGRNLMASSWL